MARPTSTSFYVNLELNLLSYDPDRNDLLQCIEKSKAEFGKLLSPLR